MFTYFFVFERINQTYLGRVHVVEHELARAQSAVGRKHGSGSQSKWLKVAGKARTVVVGFGGESSHLLGLGLLAASAAIGLFEFELVI